MAPWTSRLLLQDSWTDCQGRVAYINACVCLYPLTCLVTCSACLSYWLLPIRDGNCSVIPASYHGEKAVQQRSRTLERSLPSMISPFTTPLRLSVTTTSVHMLSYKKKPQTSKTFECIQHLPTYSGMLQILTYILYMQTTLPGMYYPLLCYECLSRLF